MSAKVIRILWKMLLLVACVSGFARAESHDGGEQGSVLSIIKRFDGADLEAKKILLKELDIAAREKKNLTLRESAASELARRARKETDRSVRARMILALRVIGGRSAVKELERFASEDPEDVIRERATYAVGAMPGNEVEFFTKQTSDKDRQVQLDAYVALADLGDKSGRELALKTLNGPSQSHERQTALWMLGEIGDPKDSALLKQVSGSASEEYENRIVAIQASKTIELLQLPSSKQLSFLINSLDDSDDLIRNWAGNKLARRSDAPTKSRLKQYLLEPGHKGYKEATNALY